MATPQNPTSRALRGRDSQQAGQYAPNAGIWAMNLGAALTASRLYVIRFVAERSMPITKIGFILTVAAGANDNCDAGIFNSALTTLLGSAGSTAGKLNGSLGLQTLNLAAPVSLKQGKVYYAAFASGTQGGTAASVLSTNTNANGLAPFGSTAPTVESAFQNTAFPIAAPVTVGGVVNSPILVLQQ